MALAKNVMGAGISSGQARAINGNNVNSAVTGTGTTLATGAAITADVNVITGGAEATGVVLYSGVPGDSQIVFNNTSTYKYVYPHSGGNVNQLAASSGFILAPYTAVHCVLTSSTQWVGFMSA